MKKILAVLMIITALFCFAGCKQQINLENNISEVCESFYSYEDENYFITLATGQREDNFVVDGKSDKLIPYAVLTVYNNNLSKTKNTGNFVLNVGGQTYSGKFEQNPFDGSFVVDLKQINNNNDITLDLNFDNIKLSCKLENQMIENFMSIKEVKALAQEEFMKIKNEFVVGKTVKAEIYYRVIKQKGLNPLCYVSLVDENGRLFALIIDPINKTLVAKNFK